MNTLNYIGCKNKLFSIILDVMKENVPDLSSKSFSDLFMGTGIVSYQMLEHCRSVSSNDLESYSYVIGNALLKCNYSDSLSAHIDICNSLPEVEGLIYKYYSVNEESERMFFTSSNAKKADAVRIYIEKQRPHLSPSEYYFLLASLLVSLDKVANTACVYGAYLKKFKKSAEKPLVIEAIHQKRDIRVEENQMTQEFAEQVEVKSDVTYLDPPYNQRSYSANYFVLNFVVRYDSNVVPRGKTGLIDKNQSDFCSKRNVEQAFSELLDNIGSRYIFLSYNNEGLLSQEKMRRMLEKKGSVKLYKILYNKFKAQKNVDGDHVYEFLWVIDTQSPSSFQELER